MELCGPAFSKPEVTEREDVSHYLELLKGGNQCTSYNGCRLELRASAEVDFMTFKRILNPVQSAHFILQSYPAKPDTLGLGKAVKDQPPGP